MIRIKKPNDIPGLVLWFDANDTSTVNNGSVKNNDLVFSFRDKKNNVELTRIVSGAGPTYSLSTINGKNVISFQPVYSLSGDPSEKGLVNTNLNILGSGTTSMFCVYQPTSFFRDDTSGNQKYIVNIAANGNPLTTGFGNKSIYLGDEGSATLQQRENPSGRYIEADPASYGNNYVTYHEHIPSRNFLPGATNSLDKVCMTVARCQNDLKKISFLFENNDYVDDFSATRTFPSRGLKLTGPVYSLASPQKFILGTYKDNSVSYGSRRYPFKGFFCEFLYYDRFLTDDETNIIKTYLKRKWYVEETQIITETSGSGGGDPGVPSSIPPVVAYTTVVTNITDKGANSGGSILSAGSGTVTARGVCWNTSPNPTIANSKTVDGNGLAAFTSTITGLSLGTTYYVRAYATNSDGLTGYGIQQTFTTLNYILPVITNFVRRTTTIEAAGGFYFGEVISSSDPSQFDGVAVFDFSFDSAGGPNIIEYGVVSNSSPNPTVANYKDSFTGIDFPTGNAVGKTGIVSSGETWYFRAYVYNGTHYAYSTIERSLQIADVRVNNIIPNYNTNQITLEGIVNLTGGLTITQRGFFVSDTAQYDPVYVEVVPSVGQKVLVSGSSSPYTYTFTDKYGYTGVRAYVVMNNGVRYFSNLVTIEF